MPELKRNDQIDKTYSRDDTVQNFSKDIGYGKKIKIMHMNTLHDRFLNFDFGEDAEKIIMIHCNQAIKFI